MGSTNKVTKNKFVQFNNFITDDNDKIIERVDLPLSCVFGRDDRCYRTQFFYSVKDLFGTGIEEYTDPGECLLGQLRLQADHESERNQQFPDNQS